MVWCESNSDENKIYERYIQMCVIYLDLVGVLVITEVARTFILVIRVRNTILVFLINNVKVLNLPVTYIWEEMFLFN